MKPPLRRRTSFVLPDAAAEWAGAALADVFPDGLLLRPRPGGVTVLQGWGPPSQDLRGRLRALGAVRIRSRLERPAPPKAPHGRFPVLRVGRFDLVPKAKAASHAPRPGRHRIVLVQGQAFGTGLHESTRLMLAALERRPPLGLEALDVGAGSGVLGFACLALGARRVVGVELEAAACAELRENRGLNGAPARRLPVFHGAYPLARLRGRRFALVLGNLVTPLLVRLMPRLASQTARGGALLCSGIHGPAEARRVGHAARAAGLRLADAMALRGWRCLRMAKA